MQDHDSSSSPSAKDRPGKVVLVDVDEFASILKVSSRTIWRLVSSGEAPTPIRIGGSSRWRLSDLNAWINEGCPRQN